MFDSIAQTYLGRGTGIAAPQQVPTMKALSSGAAPNSTGWYDPSKPWDANNPLASLNSFKVGNYVAGTPEHYGTIGTGDAQTEGTVAATMGGITNPWGGTATQVKDPTGSDPNGLYFKDTFGNPQPGSSSHDLTDVVYKYDPNTGMATPVQGVNNYKQSSWSASGPDVLKTLGTVLAAGAGGYYAGAGDAAGGAGAAEGAGGAAAEGGAYGAGGGYGAAAGDAAAGAEGGFIPAAGEAVTPAAEVGGSGGVVGGAGSAEGAAMGAGGGGSSGFWGSLGAGDWGGAASAAGDWASSPSGLQILGGLGSSYLQSKAAGNALDAQTNATNSANALQKYFYDTNRSDNAPLLATRNNALGHLNGLMSDPNSISSDPGYQFGLDQGVQGVDRSAASRGGLYSGATLKALQRYGTDYGTTKLNDAYNRYQTTAGLGAVGTNSNTSAGTNYANQTGANTTGLGNAAAGNALLNGNIWGNALNGSVSAYNNYNKPG